MLKTQENFDMLTFGSITLDLMIEIPKTSPVKIQEENHDHFLQIPLGDKIKFENSVTLCGGGAANSGVGFAKMDLKTALFGVLGDQSNRGFLVSELQRQGVCTDFVTFAKDQTSSFSVILNASNGERTVFHHRTLCEDFNYHTLLEAPKTRAIYVGHLYPGPDNMLEHLPEWKEKNPTSIIGWNPGKTQFNKGIEAFSEVLPAIDVLILNVEEAEHFTGISAETCEITTAPNPSLSGGTYLENWDQGKFGKLVDRADMDYPKVVKDLREIANKFLSMGISQVMITDGGRGAQAFTKNEHFFVPSTKVKKVDTLGAGDAFSVGVLSAKLHGKNLEDQSRWGAENSTGVIQHMGAQAGQLKREDVNAS